MYNCTPGFDMDMDIDSSALTWSALTISNSSPMSEAETTELQWKNGDVVETLLVEPYCTAQISGETMTGAAVAGTSSAAIQLAARNVTMTSPSGSAGASTSAVPPANPLPPTMEMIKNDRKRKERETDDTKSHNETMYNCTPPAFDMDMYMDSSTPTLSALTIPTTSPLSEPETELQWQNGDVVETLLVEPYSRVSDYTAQIFGGTMSGAAVTGTSSVAPANLPLPPPLPRRTTEMITDDRKRQGRETDDTESQNEDVEFESVVTKKQVCASTSSKKHRTAKIHNLAERNRRSRINEKMNALRDLIPRCNKIDKASILDEAIEYLKSLQLQVQILSTRGGMVPGMCPGGQQYMPLIIGMNQPMMSYVGMNQPMMSSVSMSQPIMSTVGMNQPMMSTVGMNQHFNQTQVPLPQNQAVVYPSSINIPDSSRDVGNF